MNFARSGILLATVVLPALLPAQSTLPVAGAAIPAQILAGGTAASVDLRAHFTLPNVTGQIAQFDTVLGKVNVELRADAAPQHVANFLAYVQAGAYAGTFFHRSAALEAGGISIVQGGGFRSSANTDISEVPRFNPVPLEYNLPNARGTLAAARTSDLNSATSQWYFNVRDNSTTLGSNNGGGYTVFGRVIGNGMMVIDAIAAQSVVNAGSPFNELPVRNLTGTSVTAANLIMVNAVTQAAVYPGSGGTSVLSFSATSSNAAVVGAAVSGSTLTLTPGTAGTASVTITATDSHGSTAVQSVVVTVTGAGASRAPQITAQPPAQIRLVTGTGNTLALAVTATGTPAPVYQWRRDKVDLPGQRSPTLVLTRATEAQAGAYTCLVSNSEGSVESQPAVVAFIAATPADTGRLINLSILSPIAAKETMTMGTVLGGGGASVTKALLARAAGPALTQLGVTDVLPDPQMALLLAGSGNTVASNNDWGGTTALREAFAQVGAFAYASASSKDAALYQPALAPGGYTVELSDTGTGAGFAIAELYDSTPAAAFTASTPRLINVSVRKQIPADTTLTAGFVIGGKTAKTVLVRAIGPTLAGFGVTETMADPRLALFDSASAKIAENDNWGGDAAIASTAAAVGAFPLGNPASSDAVLLVTLAPGSYSVQVSGKTGGGSALVEVYEVP